MKADGARITRTRKAVIECLAVTEHPLTPQAIVQLLSKNQIDNTKNPGNAPEVEENNSIDLASVYRILKYMSSLGLVHQLGSDGGFFPCTHASCNSGVHLLTRCEQCENTKEIHMPKDITAGLIWYIENETDFLPESHILEISGTCNNCRSI